MINSLTDQEIQNQYAEYMGVCNDIVDKKPYCDILP